MSVLDLRLGTTTTHTRPVARSNLPPDAGVRLGQVIYRGYCVTSVRSRLFRQGKRLGIELRRAKLKPKTDAHGSVPHLCVVHVRERVCMCAYVCVCACVCVCMYSHNLSAPLRWTPPRSSRGPDGDVKVIELVRVPIESEGSEGSDAEEGEDLAASSRHEDSSDADRDVKDASSGSSSEDNEGKLRRQLGVE